MKLIFLLSALAALATTSPIAQTPRTLSTELHPANTSAPAPAPVDTNTNTTSPIGTIIDAAFPDTASQLPGSVEAWCDAAYRLCMRDSCPFNAWGCDKICIMTTCQKTHGDMDNGCKGLNWCYAYTG